MVDQLRIDRIEERLGLLDGRRARGTGALAVRVMDASAVVEFPAAPTSSKAAGATPTKAEFDALVSDVHTIFRQMSAFSEALRVRNSS